MFYTFFRLYCRFKLAFCCVSITLVHRLLIHKSTDVPELFFQLGFGHVHPVLQIISTDQIMVVGQKKT